MATTKINVKVTAALLDEKGNPVLQLQPLQDQGAEEGQVVLVGTPEDEAEFRKLVWKVVPARLSIGAEKEAPATAPVNDHDHAARTALEQELRAARERIAVLEEEAKARPAAAPGAVDANHPVVQVARGHLKVVVEDATKHGGAAKGGSSGHFFDLARQARAGLVKLEELVGPAKKNGTTAEAPAPAAG